MNKLKQIKTELFFIVLVCIVFLASCRVRALSSSERYDGESCAHEKVSYNSGFSYNQ